MSKKARKAKTVASVLASKEDKEQGVVPVNDWTTLNDSTDEKVVAMREKVTKVTEVYNQEGTIDARDTAVIMYALGLFPREPDLETIVQTVEDPATATPGLITTDRLVAYLTHVLLECENFQPPTRTHLEAAFRTFDRDKTGLLEAAKIRDVLLKDGDPLTKDQAEDFLKFAVDEITHKIDYEDYIDKVMSIREPLASTFAAEIKLKEKK